jgi:hypothetical protein
MSDQPTHLVPLIDLTNVAGEFIALKSAVAAFVGALATGDQFALVGYGETITNIYPAELRLATVSRRTVKDATKALRFLEPQPGLRGMGNAIIAGTEILQGSAAPLGMILLAEGPNDVEPDPLQVLPLNIPIYTIALGDQAPKSLLEQIAQQTGGKYYFAADAYDLQTIFYDIIGRSDSGVIVFNGARELSNGQKFSTVARVPKGGVVLRLTASWGNPAVIYGGTSPAGVVSASILDPNFNPWNGDPTENDFGYVAFEIPDAMQGDWIVDWIYHGPSTINLTAAAIVPEI